ncbi:tRNA lysidine(34) synthetase TilS [Tepidicella baoligensis]|uniref:tRNA lysidine(34) synthetase TilS n=1 Tax=Tepidicella baoligensis TaxID=2707016 RepID=UPI003CCD2BD8
MGANPASIDWSHHPGLAALERLAPRMSEAPVAVAFSGGADSTALLFAAWHLWPDRVAALHVNHGLQAAAADFERHVRTMCASLGVPLWVAHPPVPLTPGDSMEEMARNARYRALAELARQAGAGEVWLAQHLHDQAETLLLALTRGAGLPGLAGMPARQQRHGITFVRPWLDVSGAELRGWLREQGVAWVEDPSNHDQRHTRNRIRHRLLPVLEDAFPAYAQTFARSARHAAQAQALLQELAEADLAAVGSPPVIQRLQALSAARQANVLRHWLRQVGARQASEAQLQQVLRQIAACTTRGHRIHLRVGRGYLLRQGQVLSYWPDEAQLPKPDNL